MSNASSADKKLELKLHEDNELSFKLSIEGTVSDPDLASPRFRFTIMELGEERGWIFPAKKEADDIVTVSIPAPLKSGFKANRVYRGVLEVILGRLYFSPAEVQLEFATPLEIQAEIATPTSVKNSATSLIENPSSSASKKSLEEKGKSKSPNGSEEDLYDEDEILSVIVEEGGKKSSSSTVAKPSPKKTMVSEKQLQHVLLARKNNVDPSSRETPSPPSLSEGNARPSNPTSGRQVPTKGKGRQPLLSEEDTQKKAFKAKLLNLFKSALTD